VQCLYCGKSYWRPFRRFTTGDFCSREHRASYHERLRRVAGRLSEYQSIPTEGVGAAVAAALSVTQHELSSLPGEEIIPIIECLPAAPPALEALASDPAIASHHDEPLSGTETPDLAAAEPDISAIVQDAASSGFPRGLRPREFVPMHIGDSAAAHGIWLPIPVLPSAGAAPTIQSMTAMLTPAFENYAQIKRWGLKIRFLKA
jgi:hypothetical protein